MTSPDAPQPHTRCDRNVDCPCWNAGAVAEARTRILPERSRQIVDYIRALVEGDPDLDQTAIAQCVAYVFAEPTGTVQRAARSASPRIGGPLAVERLRASVIEALNAVDDEWTAGELTDLIAAEYERLSR